MLHAMLAPALCAAMVAMLGAAFLLKTDFHNPLDEYTHYDFVIAIAQDGRVPRMNDVVGQQALEEWSCTGQMSAELTCGGTDLNPGLAPWGGASPATGYPMLYYVITAAFTRGAHTLLWNLSWFDAARVASLVWLVMLTGLVVMLGRRLGGPTSAAAAAAILLGSMPLVLSQASSVNNDIAAVFATFLTLWLWVRLVASTRRLRWSLTLLVATAALLIKPHTIVALALIAALELTLMRRQRNPADRVDDADPTHGGFLAAAAPPRPTQRVPLDRAFARGWLRDLLVVGGGVVASVAGYVVVNYFLEPAIRGAGSPVQGMAEFLASVEPQDFGLAAAKSYAGLQTVFQAAAFVPALTGTWAQLVPVFVATLALGGLAHAVLRSRRPWFEDPVTVMRQVSLAYVALFPLILMGYLTVIGMPYFSNPRYHLIGMALALALLLYGTTRAWGYASLGLACIVWAFMLREILTWAG